MGYDWGEGKSQRAVEAESRGLRTATQMAKAFNVSAKTIRTALHPVEWHHTSKMFNATDYYDPSLVTDEELAKLKALEKEKRQAKKSGTITKRCNVEYVEWSGTRRHHNKTYHFLENVDVDFLPDSDFVVIHAPDGLMRKNRGGNWIVITPVEEWGGFHTL
jgi:hypothetical protein